MRARTIVHAACRRVRARRQNSKGTIRKRAKRVSEGIMPVRGRTTARLQTPRGNAHMGRCCVPNAAAVRLKKPATGFPARALRCFAMMDLCR